LAGGSVKPKDSSLPSKGKRFHEREKNNDGWERTRRSRRHGQKKLKTTSGQNQEKTETKGRQVFTELLARVEKKKSKRCVPRALAWKHEAKVGEKDCAERAQPNNPS